MGLILIPVSSSHIGPEKLIGSSSWSPSSQATLSSACFGSIVGFESIRVTFQLPPTAAWVCDSPPRQRAGGGAGRAPWPDSGLGRRAQGVESLPQRQLVDPEIT